jgi:hypothetical protein
VLVHFADERPYFCVGKVAHAVTKDALVFRQKRQGLSVIDGVLRHVGTSFSRFEWNPRRPGFHGE